LFNKRGKATRMGHMPFGGGKSMVYLFFRGWVLIVVSGTQLRQSYCFDICRYTVTFLRYRVVGAVA
jgi:hypothetical protein